MLEVADTSGEHPMGYPRDEALLDAYSRAVSAVVDFWHLADIEFKVRFRG
jgi:hypothetical protein